MNIRVTLNSLILAILAISVISFAGCAVEESDLLGGLFIDAPVEGLLFEHGSIIGRTDSEGRFYYEGSEDITFSIEGVIVAKIPPKDFVAPFDLVTSTVFVTDPEVTNISRFIQSLDSDGYPENGITIDETTRTDFKNSFSSFSSLEYMGAGFRAISSFFTGGLRTPIAAQTHLLASLAEYERLPVDLINLGDGFTAGMQSSKIDIPDTSATSNINLHQYAQMYGYAYLLASQIADVFSDNLTWSSPTLEMDVDRNKTRTTVDEEYVVPYNIAVPGATAKSLVEEKTGDGNLMLDQLMLPVQSNSTTIISYPNGISQLDAAYLLATQEGHEQRLKLITLWIGINDVLGALTKGGGKELTEASINTFLADTVAGHDSQSVMSNISTIVEKMSGVPDVSIFIATIPDVTKMGALFYREDIEHLAAFDDPSLTSMEYYYTAADTDVVAIGTYAFAHYSSESDFTALGVSTYLGGDNASQKTAISSVPDTYSLTKKEVDLIKDRVNTLNSYIRSFADPVAYPYVFVVDIDNLFDELYAGSVLIGEDDVIYRTYGLGFFSLDGIYPSHTGYALIAKEFIERISSPFGLSTSDASYSTYTAYVSKMGINIDNGIGIKVDPEDIDLETIRSGDPYKDNDGDGFPAGPGDITLSDGSTISSADPTLDLLYDCNDSYTEYLPHALSGTDCDDL